MTKQNAIKVFEEKKVRTVWDSDKEEWYFSIVDVIEILTEQPNHQGARNYWKVLKNRMSKEGNETVTNCNRLKLPAGKMRLTDVADTEQLFRLIQSIPSPKAEPFKLWMAQVAKERLDRMQDPELSIQQAMLDYERMGYSDNWINQRLKSIEIRKDLTDEWKRHGLQEGVQFATLTDIIYKTWAGKTAKEYKQFKGLKKENLRDNMTNKELVLNMLAELSTKEISEVQTPESFDEHIDVAKQGGTIALNARLELEKKTGKEKRSLLLSMQKMCWDYKAEKWKMWIWTVKKQNRSDSTKKHTKGAVNGSLFYIYLSKRKISCEIEPYRDYTSSCRCIYSLINILSYRA